MTSPGNKIHEENKNSPTKVFLASTIGTALEYYDFLIYGIAAALVANKIFFPGNDPTTATLLSLAVFGVGFFARPVGGILAGHFSDRYGRRRVLLVTLIIMGSATFLIGVLPPHASIGVWAPLLLVILRLVQGAAAGGEWGGATLFSIESAPPNRRGFYGSFVSIGMTFGSLLAVLLFGLLAATMSPESLEAWGWRVPFLLGGAIAITGIFIRNGLSETEAFENAKSADSTRKFPLAVAFRTHRAESVKALIVSIGYSSAVYVTFTYFLSFVIKQGYSAGVGLAAQACYLGALLMLVGSFGRLSDRFGRRVVIATGATLNAVFMFVFVTMIATQSVPVLLLAFAVLGVLTACMLGPIPAALAEQFHVSVRTSGLSATYQVGNAIGGGIAPSLAVLVFAWSGEQLWSVALLSAAALAAVAGGVLLMRETAHTSAHDLGSQEGLPTAPPAQTVDA